MLDTGCAIHAPVSPQIGGNSKMNGMSNNIWRDMDKNIEIPARPMLWKFYIEIKVFLFIL